VTPASGRSLPPPDRASAGRPIPEAPGPTARRRSVVVLAVIVLAVALGAAAWGATQPFVLPAESPSLAVRVAIAAGLAALGQLARLRFRLDSSTVAVSWGEAALVIGLYVAPAGWLPAATFAGAGAAWLLLSAISDDRPPFEILHGVASLTVAVAAAAAVTTAFADPLGASVTSTTALALAAGCLAYLVITTGLAAATLALHHRAPVGTIAWQTLRGKLPMFVGNVSIGLLTIVLLAREPAWLLLLAPALWLLQRMYGQHLRAGDEQRTWQAFAAATGSLDRARQADVAFAGLRGARDLFGATRVEIDLTAPEGAHRRFVSDLSGEARELTGSGPAQHLAGPAVTRLMAVGGRPVGELSVWFPYPNAPSTRDDVVLSAYRDALAGALDDAATRQRLDALIARSSHGALHDDLTGLANRGALLADGDAALRRLPVGAPVALLVFGLRDFRNVNGTLGHRAGDELLKVTAERLRGHATDGEVVARLGDDKFALFVPRLPVLRDPTAGSAAAARLPQLQRRARDMVNELRDPVEIAGVRLVAETSVGAVVAESGAADAAELLRRAEIAIEHARAMGGGVVAYDSSLDTSNTDRLMLLADLRDALASQDQLTLVLQPAVDLNTGAPTGVEALARWRHPRRGLLKPVDFIRAVENSDLLGEFTRYVLDRSLATAAAWRADGIDVPISVNVSARSLRDPALPSLVDDALRRHRMPAGRLVLEITETAPVVNFEVVEDVVKALRALGVQLSVDDFGTGYSSLSFLTRVAVDELKVDRSFVERMVDSAEGAAIVRSTVDLGRGLNARVVAEGVETADQRAALVELGCTTAQGYLFCPPLPSDKIVAALRTLNQAASAKVLPLRADGAS
jgi:diguanylate cyclase